jgi:hypothetical protein
MRDWDCYFSGPDFAALIRATADMKKLTPTDEATRAAILESLAQAKRGEFVSDEIVAESDRRHVVQLSDQQVTEVRRRLADPNPETLSIAEFRTRLRKFGV